ncbi:AlpA family phage regulatory protein [Serratia marcescens]|uniref:helix-turn-helix transcriptional regulator n=1 Tax=Serratia TaxID=613 RepID=UPI0018825497|nr:AlpA family phage regulatory protein [Serratia marcescens]MBN5297053.1 AlpA family phage regulatory protein [Serratia marcescens]QOV56018.1 AlpA family phage regulatory protein [Serratia marcescens]HBC0577831.1 AlpA family phage regulatory protein [Serratia marcescens]HBC5197753.1 AlpA family phage regulatory protein [Serratia marcescens]
MIQEPECRAMTTLSNSTRRRMEQEGKFPKRIKIGPSAVAYRVSEVQTWIRGEWN